MGHNCYANWKLYVICRLVPSPVTSHYSNQCCKLCIISVFGTCEAIDFKSVTQVDHRKS